jgi:hypothetical protein
MRDGPYNFITSDIFSKKNEKLGSFFDISMADEMESRLTVNATTRHQLLEATLSEAIAL